MIRSIWCLVVNTFTVEGWEIERHETLVRRARVLGGYLDGPDGTRVRITQQEYPYDIGLWRNVVQGMSTANVLHRYLRKTRILTAYSGIRLVLAICSISNYI
jgi:palmitoyltransferase